MVPTAKVKAIHIPPQVATAYWNLWSVYIQQSYWAQK